MSGSGDSGSLARAGVFLAGSLLGAAIAGGSVYSSLYARKSRTYAQTVPTEHEDNRHDLPDVVPHLDEKNSRRGSLSNASRQNSQDTPPRSGRHRREESIDDQRDLQNFSQNQNQSSRHKDRRRGGHRHGDGTRERDRDRRGSYQGSERSVPVEQDPADTSEESNGDEGVDENTPLTRSRSGSMASKRREIRTDVDTLNRLEGLANVLPPRPPNSPSRASIDQSGVPRNTPGNRATKVAGRAWNPRSPARGKNMTTGVGGGGEQSEFTETDVDFENEGIDLLADVKVVSTPTRGKVSDTVGQDTDDVYANASAIPRRPSPLSGSISTAADDKVFTSSLSPKRPVGGVATVTSAGDTDNIKSASRVLAYVGAETPGSAIGRIENMALSGVDDPSLGLAPTTGTNQASDPCVTGDPGASSDVDAESRAVTARALSDSFSEMDAVRTGVRAAESEPLRPLSREQSIDMQNDQNDTRLNAPTPVQYEYGRVLAPDDELTSECEEVCLMLEHCMGLRDQYVFKSETELDATKGKPCKTGKVEIVLVEQLPSKSNHTFEMIAGVMHVYTDENEDEDGNENDSDSSSSQKQKTLLFAPPATATQFFHDMHAVLRVHSYGPSKSFCHKRLNLTEQKFSLHVMLNADREFLEQKSAPHRDFYNVRKVDTHVHHSACMNQKHLLRFIKSKLKKESHEQVIYRDGKFLNLREVFESINLSGYDLNVDTLDMRADKDTFHRFDRFNLKYNPCGQSRLREVFIKQDNLIRGRFLAEITKEVINDLDANKYQMAEYRISIYGRRLAEWDTLASWVLNNRVFSKNVVWLIQIPRLYNVYKSQGTMRNFQQMLDNIFQPLFEVTVDPASHPALHHFLQLVVGFDMVDDESKPERRPSKHMRTPEEWDVPHNPAFAYYSYYVYANLYTLNKLREAKGLNVITFRPHAGEAGDLDHLAAAFLLTKNIAHGINLRKSPVLQYLYYLAEIGLNMSPLSNNSLFLDYHRNPFPVFFARGLRVALSTDDPLQIHMTKEPLVEEYSVAAQVWKMSAADLCEVARNSVLNSDFPHQDKQHWVGQNYWEPGPHGNDIKKTNVPNVRVQFRHDVLEAEKHLIREGVKQATAKGRVLHVS